MNWHTPRSRGLIRVVAPPGKGPPERVASRAARRFVSLAVVCLLLFLPRCARALEIDQVVWGFDGVLVPNRFNLLSVLVSNSTSNAFDGRLELRKVVGLQRIDAPIVEELYLAPHSSRWVQFYPYALNDMEEWTVSWGSRPKDEFALSKPRQGPVACVLLEEPDALPVSTGAIRRFPANLFPVQVTATDGLRAVALDHSPRWEEPRQRAFLDWLRRGGSLHLLHDSRGSYPVLTGLLAPLNSPLDRTRFGSGMVIHHARSRRDLTQRYVEQAMGGSDRGPVSSIDGEPVPAPTQLTDADKLANPTFFGTSGWERDDPFLTALKKMSRPNHRWVLIHLLSLVYLLLVFPGCYIMGLRRAGDYRYVFGALLSTIVVFSLAFHIIGRRGHGEATAAHTIALARALEGGRYDVSGWTDAFAVSGGDYMFTHEGVGRIYSTCQDQEAVRGVIRYGTLAGLTADLPPFSSRTFGYRAIASGPAISASVETIETAQQMRQEHITLRDFTNVATPSRAERILQRLVLAKGPGFPTEYRQVYAVYGRYVYLLAEKSNKLELRTEVGSIVSFLKLDQNSTLNAFYDPWEHFEGTPDELFGALSAPLVARSLDLRSQKEAVEFRLPEDRLRLLVYAPLPVEFQLRGGGLRGGGLGLVAATADTAPKNEVFPGQDGYVLYSVDVFLESVPAAAP